MPQVPHGETLNGYGRNENLSTMWLQMEEANEMTATKRTHSMLLQVRLTPEEKVMLVTQAEDAGLKMSDYIRQLIRHIDSQGTIRVDGKN